MSNEHGFTDQEIEQVSNLITWHLRCGPGCKGPTHQEITWVTPMPSNSGETMPEREIAAALLLALYHNEGVYLVRQELAPAGTVKPEGRELLTSAVKFFGEEGSGIGIIGDEEMPDALRPAMIPYIVTFKSPWKVGALRDLFWASFPQEAEQMGMQRGEEVKT